MPIGYFVSMLFPASATLLALSPRPTRGPRATPAFVLESVVNEVPFVVFSWLPASTALALAQHDVDSPLGWVAVGIGLLTTVGLAIVVTRAARARPTLDAALVAALGAGWRDDLDPRMARQLHRHIGLGRALISPLHLPSWSVRRTRDVPYGPAGKDNRLDVYVNRERPVAGPMFVYFHGGGFFSGSKNRAARPIIERLVRDGWVCVNANYRLRGAGGGFPSHLIDAKLAIAWAREHAHEYGGDPRTVFVAGGSAGANLAAMCALTPNDPVFQPGFEQAETSVAAAIALYGYYGASGGSDALPSAPADYVRADAPPLFVVHGTHDPMVPVQQARHFVEELRRVSTSPVAYAELPGAQHNFDRLPSIRCAAVADSIEAFAAWVRTRMSH